MDKIGYLIQIFKSTAEGDRAGESCLLFTSTGVWETPYNSSSYSSAKGKGNSCKVFLEKKCVGWGRKLSTASLIRNLNSKTLTIATPDIKNKIYFLVYVNRKGYFKKPS